MVWIGDRTRQLDGAHVEFLRGVNNPIGGKIGPTAARRSGRALRRAQPRPRGRPPHAHHPYGRRPRGRVAPAAAAGGHAARSPRGLGVRPDARQHLHQPAGARPATSTTSSPSCAASSTCTAAEGTWPGGVHVELTGDDVTECLGGAEEILDVDLDDRYTTTCDPRLNARQSLDLAFRIAELLRRLSGREPTWMGGGVTNGVVDGGGGGGGGRWQGRRGTGLAPRDATGTVVSGGEGGGGAAVVTVGTVVAVVSTTARWSHPRRRWYRCSPPCPRSSPLAGRRLHWRSPYREKPTTRPSVTTTGDRARQPLARIA